MLRYSHVPREFCRLGSDNETLWSRGELAYDMEYVYVSLVTFADVSSVGVKILEIVPPSTWIVHLMIEYPYVIDSERPK